ncbi:hypothetical protein JOQ06_010852, partial [Pogonophryne albipinna]
NPCKHCNSVFTEEPKAAAVCHRRGPSQLKERADRVNLSPMLMRSREHSRGLNTNRKMRKSNNKDGELEIRVVKITLSLSAVDKSRRQQNPTGDPHLSDLSSPPSCNHGPRHHRRDPGAPSPSPRWGHVARCPHTPGKSWLLPVLCVRLLLTGDEDKQLVLRSCMRPASFFVHGGKDVPQPHRQKRLRTQDQIPCLYLSLPPRLTEFTDTEFTLILTPALSSGLTPAVSSGLTPHVSSGLTPAAVSSGLTPATVSSGLTPAVSSGLTPPVTSDLTPATVSSGLTPATVSSGLTPPVTSDLTPAVSSGLTPAVSSGLTPAVSSGLTPAVSSGLTPALSSGLTPALSSGLTPALSSGLTPALSSGLTPALSSGLTPALSSGLTAAVSSGLTPALSSGLTPALSSGLTAAVSSGLTPALSSGLTPALSSGLTPALSSGLTPALSSGLTPPARSTMKNIECDKQLVLRSCMRPASIFVHGGKDVPQ